MPDFFTVYYALVTSIVDGSINEGELSMTDQTEDRLITLMVTISRDATEPADAA